MNINLSINFNNPMGAESIKDFWHRWHISLSTWFRDYIYISLGGNRTQYKYIAITSVFLLSGLWHGITLNFLYWGIFHCIIYFLDNIISKSSVKLPKVIRQTVVFFVISFGWCFFYFEDSNAISMFLHDLTRMNQWCLPSSFMTVLLKHKVIVLLTIYVLFIRRIERLILYKTNTISYFLHIDIMIINLILFGFSNQIEFAYFKF